MTERGSLITVSTPLLPDLKDFEKLLEDIWNRKWITNNGEYHKKLEAALSEYLGVKYISLFTNGTLPLITAFQALDIRQGEVITTPYSFVATSHSIWWKGLTPVFVDVDPITGNINPEKIESAITEKTIAIMPVHVYGTPCDTDAIKKIAEKHNLKVIYDAAHAFGVKVNGKSILMDEIRAAYGLLNLKQVDSAIESRKQTANKYKEAFKNVKGIRFLEDIEGVRHKYSYFPIFINAVEYGMTRKEGWKITLLVIVLMSALSYSLLTFWPAFLTV